MFNINIQHFCKFCYQFSNLFMFLTQIVFALVCITTIAKGVCSFSKQKIEVFSDF